MPHSPSDPSQMANTAEGRRAPGLRRVRIEERSFAVALGDGGLGPFWDRVSAGGWEPQTFAVFRRFLRPGTSLVDVGAWIGPTALYGARLGARVHAIEPDPAAHAELAANVAANPDLQERIVLHRLCIAAESGPVKLYAGGMYAHPTSRFGDSMSGLLPTGDGTCQASHEVEGVSLADFMAAHAVGDCALIKMDVEGGEYALIPGRWRALAPWGPPPLCVSFHAPAAAEREALIGACLEELAACYPVLIGAGDGAPIAVEALARVRDWGDEDPASDWRRLERRLGEGVVASHAADG